MLNWFKRSESQFEHIQQHINPHGPGLLPGGDDLPDEAEVRGDRPFGFAAGLIDQFAGSNSSPSKRVDELVQALLFASRTPTRAARMRLEKVFTADDCIEWIDQLGERIGTNPAIHLEKLRPLLRSLVLRTGRRGVLKYAVALLGLCGHLDDAPLFETVGRHEEFTLYAAVALANTTGDPVESWFRLAKQVTGWGKIELVTRICEAKPLRVDIREWLLRHGCENQIMNEYLGLVVAQGADLVGALRQDRPDKQLISGAGVILAAMTHESPCAGFSEYADGPEAVRLYLNHLQNRQEALASLVHVGTLHDYLTSTECTWPELAELAALASTVLDQPHWPALVAQYIDSADQQEASLAWRASRILHVNVTPNLRAQVIRDPLNGLLWHRLVSGCDKADMEAAMALAQQLLPVVDMFTGPEITPSGFVRYNTPFTCMNSILQELRQLPGTGGDLLVKALRSRDESNRVMAVRALHEWPPIMVTEIVRTAVKACAIGDPSENIRRFAQETLSLWDQAPDQ